MATPLSTRSRPTSGVRRVWIRAITLSAHTKLPIDTVVIDFVGDSLCQVPRPAAFAGRLARALQRSDTVAYGDFRQHLVRMRVRVEYRDGRWSDLFLDKGGKYALFHRRVYRLRDAPRLSRLLRQALPADSSRVLDPKAKQGYRQEYYAPMERKAL